VAAGGLCRVSIPDAPDTGRNDSTGSHGRMLSQAFFPRGGVHDLPVLIPARVPVSQFSTTAERRILRYLWESGPEIAGDVVYRVPRCLAPCQPVSPVRPRRTAPAPPLVTFPVTQKALSLPGKGLDLRKLVAGAGFEPATSGL
jgi:hypothetical protein